MTTPRQINIMPVNTQSIIFDTGVNEAVSSIEMKPSDLLTCKNYYITEGVAGGYVSVAGYERYDGQTAPSSVLATSLDDAAREAARTAIGVVGGVDGIGPVRGVYVFQNGVYAFRDKIGGTAAGMYKATAAGWIEVDTSAAPLLPGGSYSFITHNFFANSTGERMYWCNGVDHARSFDGTTVNIMDNTGMGASDKPTYIAAHIDRLWLSYPGGSLQYSVVGMDFDNDGIDGEADDWSSVNGAGEIGIGGEITALRSSVGSTLIIFGRDFIKIFEGPSIGEGVLKTFSDSLGAYPHTVDKLFDTIIFMSDMGVTTLAAAQEFGDFSTNTISERVKRTLFTYKSLITCAITLKKLNQYRLYFSDGRCIVFSFYNKKLRGATFLRYVAPVLFITEGMESSGDLVSFFSSNSGYAYQADVGTSFDGTVIEHNFATSYFHYSSPRNWKRFFRITLEIDSVDEMTFYIKPSFDYSGDYYPASIENTLEVTGAGDQWDQGLWDQMMWAGSAVTNRLFYDILGIGSNMNVALRYSSKYTRQHTFQDMIVDFTVMGRQMG